MATKTEAAVTAHRTMADRSLSLGLAELLVRMREREVPARVLELAATSLLDYLAAVLAGARSRTAEAGLGVLESMGPGPCTLIGQDRTAGLAGAVFFNGLVAHAEEVDDSHRYVSGLHPGAVVHGAALPLAERLRLNGKDYIIAILNGYEAAVRICRCVDKAHRERGFHSTGTMGPFGSAAAAAAAMGLDRDATAHALGIAASSSAGLFAFLEDGATVKHFHTGRAALDGWLAADLASRGMTGPAKVLEADEGFFHAYAARYDVAPLAAPWDGRYELEGAYYKLHSACGHSFPAIDAALALRGRLPGGPESVGKLVYRSYRAASLLDNTKPGNLQEARFSIPFLMALALARGCVTRRELTPEVLADPVVLSLAAKAVVLEDPAISADFPRLRAGELDIETVDGQTLSIRVDVPRGMPDNPVSLADIRAKFLVQAQGVLDPGAAEQVADAASRLHEIEDMAGLLALLRTPQH